MCVFAQFYAVDCMLRLNIQQKYGNTPQHRRRYSYKFKRQVLEDLKIMSTYASQDKHGVPRRTIRNWDKDRIAIFGFGGSEKGQAARPGRVEIIPFATDLITFMKDRRRQEKVLCTVNLIQFIKIEHAE